MRNRRKALGYVIGICVVLALSVGLGAFFRYYDYPFVAAQAESVANAYRQAGLPWEAADLRVIPPVKDEDNAAHNVRFAIAVFSQSGFNAEDRDLLDLLDQGKYQAVNSRISAYHAALDLAATAAQKPSLDFHRDWDEGVNLLVPEITPMKSFVRAFCIRAEARAGVGDSAGAIKDLNHAHKLSQLISLDGDWLSIIVRNNAEKQVYVSVARVASLFANQPQALSKLEAILVRPTLPRDYRRAIDIHTYMMLVALRNNQINVDCSIIPPPATRKTGLPMSMAGKAYAVKLMRFSLEAKPILDEYGDDFELLAKHRNALADKVQTHHTASDFYNVLLFPTIAHPNQENDLSARRMTTLWMIRALAIQAKTGVFPKTVEEVPGDWTDPFSGNPLRLVKNENSIRIYSIGADRIDSGGYRFSESKPTTNHDDIVTSYPPLKARDR